MTHWNQLTRKGFPAGNPQKGCSCTIPQINKQGEEEMK